jgi:predicted Rossmann-fold nucleotide-binding protein
MKGPMKGAAVGHAKQRRSLGRYVGLTEPTIIAAEAPNPIVNELVILPDLEKRLEAFVRLAHAIIVFPGGAGTAEEVLYLLGILLDERNADIDLPIIMTGPPSAASYFEMLGDFIEATLGASALERFSVIIGAPDRVAQAVAEGVRRIASARTRAHESFFFNWRLNIDVGLQRPFVATHASMAALDLSAAQSTVNLAINLRRAFSGIVAGNVREEGVRLVAEKGPFEIHGEPAIAKALDTVLRRFVAERRMKLSDPQGYQPCFRVVG